MKASDIKAGYIYYVDYEPVRNGEFNGVHLSIVLKKNSDKYTFVVMPLTSSANGDGINKINIGKIAGFPPNIKGKDTYAVYNQVRTVNADRFRYIKDTNGRIDVPINRSILSELYNLFIGDILFNINQDEKISILKKAHETERFNKAKDIAYNIIKLRKSGADEETITALKKEIRDTLKEVSYTLDAKQTVDGIQKIFDESLKI